jgi:hypothetical protein
LKAPRSKLRGIKPQNPQPAPQLPLDVLTMELRRRLFAAWLLDLWADACCMARTPDGTATGTCGPKCTAPSWLCDRRDPLQDCTGGHPCAGLHNRGWTGGGNRLKKAVPRSFLRANLQAHQRLPLGDLPTDLFEHRIDMDVTHDAALCGRTDQLVHQDGDMVARREIGAHTSDHNGSKHAKQASGNLTPRDSTTNSIQPVPPPDGIGC